jgi:hypothetical protein
MMPPPRHEVILPILNSLSMNNSILENDGSQIPPKDSSTLPVWVILPGMSIFPDIVGWESVPGEPDMIKSKNKVILLPSLPV